MAELIACSEQRVKDLRLIRSYLARRALHRWTVITFKLPPRAAWLCAKGERVLPKVHASVHHVDTLLLLASMHKLQHEQHVCLGMAFGITCMRLICYSSFTNPLSFAMIYLF